jgi:hypothetical protein
MKELNTDIYIWSFFRPLNEVTNFIFKEYEERSKRSCYDAQRSLLTNNKTMITFK